MIAAPNQTRPTWYAGRDTRLGEFWTMLHLPYTGMVLAFVVLGAAVSPRISWTLLGGTLLAYFLGLGIGAHFLDQVPGMGSTYVTHWPAWALWSGGSLALGGAVALGLVGAFWFVGPPLLVLVAVQALCAVGYPLAAWFGGALHRDGVFALSWGSLPFLTSFYAQTRGVTVESLLVAAVFAAVALLEIHLSRVSRRLRSQTATPGLSVRGTGTPPYRRADLALQALSVGTILLALAVVAGRLATMR